MVNAQEVFDKRSGSHVKLVKVRNPYGTESKREWEGDWSDNSPLFSEDIRKQLGEEVVEKIDGEFWMSI